MSDRNIRRHPRMDHRGPIGLSWADPQGVTRYARGKCMDISAAGLRVETPEPVPVHQMVTVNVEQLRVAGSATVRHVQRKGLKYVVGLDLSQTWGIRAMEALNAQQLAPAR